MPLRKLVLEPLQRCGDGIEQLVDLGRADVQRRTERDHVSERSEDDAVLERELD